MSSADFGVALVWNRVAAVAWRAVDRMVADIGRHFRREPLRGEKLGDIAGKPAAAEVNERNRPADGDVT
jgi:hypothetical protein